MHYLVEQPPMDSELQRYIEYLQRWLLTPGSEREHDTNTLRQIALNHRARLADIARRVGGSTETVEEFDRLLAQYSPQSEFDSCAARVIFQRTLTEIVSAAGEINRAPVRPVVFANSTDLSASALARPSVSEHLLFAGIGTIRFVSDWAKLVASINCSFRNLYGAASMTHNRLRSFFRGQDIGLGREAIMLARHYIHTGSAVGYPYFEVSVDSALFRGQLQDAMYGFVVGHEVGHCYFAEQREAGLCLAAIEEEAHCDRYAVAVSRVMANHDGNWIAFAGAGAYLFLRLAAICRPLVASERTEFDRTHPASEDRAEAIRVMSIENTVRKQRKAARACLGEFVALADTIEVAVAAVSEMVRKAGEARGALVSRQLALDCNRTD